MDALNARSNGRRRALFVSSPIGQATNLALRELFESVRAEAAEPVRAGHGDG